MTPLEEHLFVSTVLPVIKSLTDLASLVGSRKINGDMVADMLEAQVKQFINEATANGDLVLPPGLESVPYGPVDVVSGPLEAVAGMCRKLEATKRHAAGVFRSAKDN
jgi:hypothetical protein